MAEKQNEKARRYAGQLISIMRPTAVLSVTDRLSHVDDKTDATYLELLHPASVYRISILGDIKQGVSAIANIRPEDVRLMLLRMEFAEKKLFEMEIEKNAGTQANAGAAKGSEAFTVTFKVGRLQGKTPGGYLCEAKDKDAAIKDLRSHYDFLAKNVEKYKGNQVIMDAINNAIGLYKQGKLDNGQPGGSDMSGADIYATPEKTFRKNTKTLNDGRVLTRAYQIRISFVPGNNYPYQVTIRNRYVMIEKNQQTGSEISRSLVGNDKEMYEECVQYKMSLSSGEMFSVINAMQENLYYYKSCVYKNMRAIDQQHQEANRKAWKPQ